MMINPRYSLKFISLLACLFLLVGASIVFSGEKKTDVIEKIKIANEYVTGLGYDVNKLTPLVSLHIVPWNDCFPEKKTEGVLSASLCSAKKPVKNFTQRIFF